jgi:hypothetical protein
MTYGTQAPITGQNGRKLDRHVVDERPGRRSGALIYYWSMLNMPSGTPAIWIWRQIEGHCGSS